MMKQQFLMNFGHVNGNFEGPTVLLNEGYTSVSTNAGAYENEQLMARLMIETFGDETIREGYYGFDLTNALTNKIVEKTGRDNKEVYSEVTSFLEEIQDVLYRSADIGLEFRKDSILMQDYDNLFKKFEEYYEAINEEKMSNNIIATSIADYLQEDGKRTKLRDGEHIVGIEYNKDGSAKISVGRRRDEFSYRIGLQTTTETASSISRDYIVNSENKNNTNMFSEIKDENIEYISDLYGDIEK